MIANDRRRAARDVIAAVLENMRHNLEPLKYSTLAPSRYLVYLHPSEYARLAGIVPILRAETERALGEELRTLNSGGRLERYGCRWLGRNTPAVEPAGGEWHVEFLPDPDGELAEGDILIDSELLLPVTPELGAGARTRRVRTTAGPDSSSTVTRTTTDTAPAQRTAAWARIVYADNGGEHTYEITKDSVSIGRGGVAYPVDIKIVSSVDVSREHARIRRDAATGRFFLIDLSSLGTTLNGRHIPKGYDEVNGTKRENGQETPLPDEARVGLAETVYLSFTARRS
jgi:hypothetical protein